MNRDLRYKSHGDLVAIWIEESTQGFKKNQLAEHFQKGIAILLESAKRAVGDLTLISILDRVLYNSAEQFPLLGLIKIVDHLLDFSLLDKNLKDYSEKELKQAFHYLIAEFLFIIGRLTGEQLTPKLHRALRQIGGQRKNEKKDKS